mgnify:CR=1 FL=1
MHICLDFLQELMQQPSLNKQIFAIQLLSHLCIQYALPKSLNLCIVALNLLYALLGSKLLMLIFPSYKHFHLPRFIKQPTRQTLQTYSTSPGQNKRSLPAPSRRHSQPNDATSQNMRIPSFTSLPLRCPPRQRTGSLGPRKQRTV